MSKGIQFIDRDDLLDKNEKQRKRIEKLEGALRDVRKELDTSFSARSHAPDEVWCAGHNARCLAIEALSEEESC